MITVLPQKNSSFCMLLQINFTQSEEITDEDRLKIFLKKSINEKIANIETINWPLPIVVQS
ncbi:MAG: hypothetical protein ACK6DA_03460 [Candidatus Kapaibacterium sp.]|jgi:hypothetical protein